MSTRDAATNLSLSYLAAIQERLKVSFDSSGLPICVVDRIDAPSAGALRDDLTDLLGGESSWSARDATVEYGKAHVQTVGFGLSADFNRFVKLGLLYGDRVVLWDVIGSRLLASEDVSARTRSTLAEAACNLLLLRPLVELGGAVILPHPTYWSSLAENLDADLRSRGNQSATVLGLSMALSAIDEGLPLHPYTLLKHPETEVAATVKERQDDLYSEDNYVFQKALTKLLNDQRFAYLGGVSAAEFYRIVSEHKDLSSALRKHFVSDLRGLSPQQTEVALNDLNDDVVKLIEKRNSAVLKYVAEGGEATALFTLGYLGALTNPSASISLAIGGIATRLWIALRKWGSTPDQNVIVQTFRDFKAADAEPQTYRPQSVGAQGNQNTHTNVADRKAHFMAFDDIEDRGNYLKSLPLDQARELLKSLDSDDLEAVMNFRRFQHDYLGDYLVELKEVDIESYWRHLQASFQADEGVLHYDNDDHFDTMMSEDMPLPVWNALLRSLVHAHREELIKQKPDHVLEQLIEVVKYQTVNSSRSQEKVEVMRQWMSQLAPDDKRLVSWLVQAIYQDDVPHGILIDAK